MLTKLKVNQPVPGFTLPTLCGQPYTLLGQPGKITFLQFWSAECSWCQQVDQELQTLLADWSDEVEILYIASHPFETRQMLKKTKENRKLDVPVLFDEDQLVANLFGARVTPHCFVIDENGVLRYQGAYNDMTFRKRESRRHYVREVVNALLAGKIPSLEETPVYGCALIRN